jgi:site-specific recombinase XerD
MRIASGGGMPPAGTALALVLAGPADSGTALRKMMISEFCEWLRSRTNKKKLPFADETITAYKVAARALDAWMPYKGIDDDFTACDTATLNRFFADYLSAHGQAGTNTRQRNLRHLFTWLESAYGHPHPYTDQLNRYAPLKVRPSTLSLQFIADLLEVTGNGQARCFADARDHVLIRFVCEGVRRSEAVKLKMTDLPPDLIAQPYVRVTPIKGARSHDEGRLVPLSPATGRAIIA